MPQHRTDRSILLALLLLNLVVKCSWLGTTVLSNDEPFTVYWSQRPWSALWPMLATENNPPLYFLLIKMWSAVVPFEAAWLRVPAAVFSSFTVWPLFLLGLKLGGRRAAWVAALLFTFSNYHYGFAHEVRAYALFTLLTTTSLWLLVRERSHWLQLGVVNVLLVYTHFFGWLAVGLQFLLVLALPELRPRLGLWWKALACTLVAYLPYAAVFLGRLGTSVSQGTWLEEPVLEELYNMLWRWSDQPMLVVLFLALIIAAGVRLKPLPLGWRIGVVWAFAPLVGMFLVSFAVPMFLDRYLVYAAPGFVLLVGISVDGILPRRTVGQLVAMGIVGAMLFTFTPWKGSARQPQQVVQQVEAWCQGECELQVKPSWYALNYAAAKDIQLLRSEVPMPAEHTVNAPATVMVVDAGADLEDPARNWRWTLGSQYTQVDSVEADHKVWVYRFTK